MARAAPAVLCLLAAPALAQVPAFETLRNAHVPSDVAVLDRRGELLQLLRVDHAARRGPWLTLADISPALRDAIVLSEDRRFWDHAGVDWRALAASAWANAWNQKTRGASTLTMQLAGLTDEQLARPSGGRSIGRKLSQMQRAREFEARWSKAQIIEAYLNRVPLRGELVGVAAAANVLFGKHASGLDNVEAALLAAMVRAPNATPAVIERRACEVLRQQQQGCAAVAITLAQALARKPGPLLGASEGIAPHLAQHIQRTTRPGPDTRQLQTTLDARLQRLALSALRTQLAELRGRNVEDGAVVVLDNHSGAVLAWVGSVGAASDAADVDAVLARRQPGSTLKPFIYALALQRRLITAASLLDDSPLQINAGAGLYQPQNYDHNYKGLVSVRQALAGSLNVPAVRVGAMLGPDALFDGFNSAGLQLAGSAGHHGHALALGSAEVSLLALGNAYRMLANGGRFGAVHWLGGAAAKPAPTHMVFEPAVSHIVADMLADPAARAATFGLDSALVTRGWAAVKTGTSKDMRDNWCVGFSSRYTVAVWVGNVSGAAMHGVSGVSGAAPVWRALMMQLHAHEVSRAPATPPGL
ncbi:MAG TPA: penicillin-binding protein 1C, partial [Rubrivivax sp.]|nr:penicillin-binding protein 1C [Rubrivivax sp.]